MAQKVGKQEKYMKCLQDVRQQYIEPLMKPFVDDYQTARSDFERDPGSLKKGYSQIRNLCGTNCLNLIKRSAASSTFGLLILGKAGARWKLMMKTWGDAAKTAPVHRTWGVKFTLDVLQCLKAKDETTYWELFDKLYWKYLFEGIGNGLLLSPER